jgi:hypothetical protein
MRIEVPAKKIADIGPGDAFFGHSNRVNEERGQGRVQNDVAGAARSLSTPASR